MLSSELVMIYSFRGDTSKAGSLIPDWPENNPVPVTDASRMPIQSLGHDSGHPQPGLKPGHMPSVFLGERIPEQFWHAIPRTVRVRPQPGKKWPVGRLKDFQGFHYMPLVSARARDLIETLDAGVHQFFPVNIVRADNEAPLFEGESYFLINACGTESPEEFFPFDAVQRRIAAGEFDHDARIRGELLDCMIERRFPGDIVERVFAGERFRWYWPENRNRLLINKGFVSRFDLFVLPTVHRRLDGVLTIYGGGNSGFCQVTEKFRQAVKKAKLSGGQFEPCTEVD